MKLIKRGLSSAYRIYCIMVFLLGLILLYPLFYVFLSKKKYFILAFRLKKIWSVFVQISFLLPIRVKGKEKLPPPPFIVCTNHTSYLDIIHMYSIIPYYFLFLGKHEILKWPLLKIFFKSMNIAVNRDNNIQAARSLVKAKQAIDNKESIIIFPEGTIPTSPPNLGEFKNGAFQLAIDKQVPIVPITLVNTWSIFPCTDNLWGYARPGIAKAVIHDFISTKGLSENDLVPLRSKVFNLIQQTVAKDESN